jgi:hypothetical protein
LEKNGVTYTEEAKNFAITLHMYSPKAYDFVREKFPLPSPRTIQRWLTKVDGRPGVFQEALSYLAGKATEDSFNYKECVLMFDGMSMNDDLEWDAVAKKTTGYVDVGNGPDEDAGRLKEAIVFMAAGLFANWKLPIGYLLIKGKKFVLIT